MIAWSMCMLGHPMKWYVQKEALSKSSKNISFTDDSVSHYTGKPFFCYVGPFLWCIDENRNEKIQSSLVFTAAITSGLPPAHTSISRETVDFSCCITNLLPRKQERAKKKKNPQWHPISRQSRRPWQEFQQSSEGTWNRLLIINSKLSPITPDNLST